MTDAQAQATTTRGRRRPASRARRAVGRIAPLLIRPRPGEVCFASIPDFTDSAYWMYRHLLTSRSGLRFTWLLHEPDLADQVEADFRQSGRSERHTLQVLPWHSPAAYRAYLRSSVVFHTHGVYNFTGSHRDRTVISLWHGMPLKVIGALEDSGVWANDVGGDIHVASSRLFRTVIAAAFSAHPRSVLLSGLPRNDVLKGHTSPIQNRAEIASALGLDPARPIVVWLPTHRNDTHENRVRSFLDQVDPKSMNTLVESCASHRCQVVVKLHYLDALNDSGGDQMPPDRVVTFITSEKWSRVGVQLYDLLAAADGLITDLSSAAIDFLHTGRPIGILGYDESTYERDMIVPVGPLTASAAVFPLRDAADIDAFVRRVDGRAVIDLPDDDVARWVNEDEHIHSSEQIAQEAGL